MQYLFHPSIVALATKKVIKDSKALATLCAKSAGDKNATDITLLRIGDVDGAPSEWFVIVSCQSEPQMRSIAETLLRQAKSAGVDTPRSEGWDSMNWIIIDFFDVVVHVMRTEAREFYKLEKLWSEGERYTISAAGRVTKARASSKKTASESIE